MGGVTLPKPYYQDDWCTIYCADCREVMPELGRFDLLLTDPPYPNNAGHFDESIFAAAGGTGGAGDMTAKNLLAMGGGNRQYWNVQAMNVPSKPHPGGALRSTFIAVRQFQGAVLRVN